MAVTKILIANRGEIAVRVAKTAKRMGIPTVAVYSDADCGALHTQVADEAVAIGGNAPSDSYLVVDKIIDAAKRTGADAIHPGYGFLSENAEFAQRLKKEGITFIGPTPQAIEVMGDKAGSKRAMIAADVPTVPGFQDDGATDAQLIEAARTIGFPLMVKASAGGGGRGMRRVFKESELKDAIATARSEAKNAFGNDELILEKFVTDARHVEVQVFADTHGHVIHLGERDCSLQRRNQKVIEEAPCPIMTPELRARMGEAAVNAARAVEYVGAGTVEFLLGQDMEFYFLEMNTRLQVEHPVTEEVTGLDLVELQIRVARGEPLGIDQGDVELNGHAFEARLYAEDPANGFLPQAGTVSRFYAPDTARVDSALNYTAVDGCEPQDVPSAYDPMIAKIIVHGETRDAALTKLESALAETLISGIATNRDFLLDVIRSQTFKSGETTTNWLDSGGMNATENKPELIDFEAAAVTFCLRDQDNPLWDVPDELIGFSNWDMHARTYTLRSGERVESFTVRTGEVRPQEFEITRMTLVSDGEDIPITVKTENLLRYGYEIGDRSWSAVFDDPEHDRLIFATDRGTFAFQNTSFGEREAEGGAGSGIIRAPMHGLVVSLDIAAGTEVSAGDKLGTLEAMKMQHPIRADVDGTVEEVSAKEGEQVASGDLLLRILPSAPPD